MDQKVFFYRDESMLKKMYIDDIIIIEAINNYVKFWALNYDHLVRTTLWSVMSRLDGYRFVQINRSIAVAREAISIISDDSVILTTGQELTVTKKYWDNLIHSIKVFDSLKPGCDENCDRPFEDWEGEGLPGENNNDTYRE